MLFSKIKIANFEGTRYLHKAAAMQTLFIIKHKLFLKLESLLQNFLAAALKFWEINGLME